MIPFIQKEAVNFFTASFALIFYAVYPYKIGKRKKHPFKVAFF